MKFCCKVCGAELKSLSGSEYLFTCIDYPDEEDTKINHNHAITYWNNVLLAEEIVIYNRNDNTGYLVDVSYEEKKTLFAVIKNGMYADKMEKNIVYSFDNFDRQSFIDRFEKLMVLF